MIANDGNLLAFKRSRFSLYCCSIVGLCFVTRCIFIFQDICLSVNARHTISYADV